ncbi:bifunctional alpha/beta hydrolase/OsmC family protein [Agaribacterium haliotis]|jgi:putative redox protein|uniref:bifunctional alpha/beta hydrolase/OsmC family protein n=1 Tax=Agaribacterium haliotis TaxID=2013869 RepID=UPI000BB53474|nr:bifunctional alpha/beta hydrolase/OsmC family protein [Agaribacterium haliotis]EKO3631373.1 OsmC family protein [Vibrio metschnikovii]EKO3669570.1 OsmC family protein [Vibrio metschnikovii]EKO3728421.1 OsmC family protein [Vibrio metschnikovii]
MKNKVEFVSNGVTLRGMLESPDQNVSNYALFAHCFTCGKDIAAASRIARALTEKGIAVLRFDFTGLGNSDGDFSNTNYSSNVEDLKAAADFLKLNYRAPSLLIGHSLGGAAVLSVAHQLPEVKAIATIGAPHEAQHVVHNFAADVDTINQEGQAEVTLGFRKFVIKKQFIDDVAQSESKIGSLKKALLVMHSPMDSTVNIAEAEKIYKDAKHPKSFVSLDNADHLVSNKGDADYIATTIAAWASRYIELPTEERVSKDVHKGHVYVEEKDHKFAQNVYSDSHHWLADEPTTVGGNNSGPDPYEHLLAALGTCTSMTIRMYANRKKWPLENIGINLYHERSYNKDCQQCDEAPQQIDYLNREITLEGDLDNEQREKLLEIADKCPVHKTLHEHLVVNTKLGER